MRFTHVLFVILALAGIFFSVPFTINTVSASLDVNLNSDMRLDTFSSDTQNVYIGDSIQFSQYYINSGNTVLTLSPALYIYKINGNNSISIENITFTNITLAGGETATFLKSWSTTSQALGNYIAYANATYNSTQTQTKNISFTISNPPPPAPQGSGSSSQSNTQNIKPIIPTHVPPKLKVPTTPIGKKISVSSQSILKDILAGSSTVTYVVLNNPTDTPIKVSSSSSNSLIDANLEYYLPAQSETTLPIQIKANKFSKSGFIPSSITLSLNDGEDKIDVPIVLNILPKSKKTGIDVVRDIKYNDKTKKIIVNLAVTNNEDTQADLVKLNEQLASSFEEDQIEFQYTPSSISSGKVTWEISALGPYETRLITYMIPFSDSALETISSNSINQIVVVDSPGNQRVLLNNIQTDYDSVSNIGHIRVSFFNAVENTKSVYSQLISPIGWVVEPKDKTINIPGRTEKTVEYVIRQSRALNSGSYPFNLLIQYDEQNLNRQIFIKIGDETAVVWSPKIPETSPSNIFENIIGVVMFVSLVVAVLVILYIFAKRLANWLRAPSYKYDRVSEINEFKRLMEDPPQSKN